MAADLTEHGVRDDRIAAQDVQLRAPVRTISAATADGKEYLRCKKERTLSARTRRREILRRGRRVVLRVCDEYRALGAACNRRRGQAPLARFDSGRDPVGTRNPLGQGPLDLQGVGAGVTGESTEAAARVVGAHPDPETVGACRNELRDGL